MYILTLLDGILTCFAHFTYIIIIMNMRMAPIVRELFWVAWRQFQIS